jgi:hypothetical protein
MKTTMIKNGFLILLIFSALSSFAQSDSTYFPKKHKLEFGINVTSVLSNFVGNNADEVTNAGDFPLSAKILMNHSAIRFGAGLQWTGTKKQVVDQFTLLSANNNVFFRTGYEYRTYIGKRWMMLFGVDGIANYFDKTSNTVSGEIITLSRKGFGVGAGPVYGLQFALSKRIHLGCEGSLYWLYTMETEKNSFSLNPLDNTTAINQSFAGNLTSPKWLYAIVRF